MRRRWSAMPKRHGLLVIALTHVMGRLLWTSIARPARLGDHRLPPRRPGRPTPRGRPRRDRRLGFVDLGFVDLGFVDLGFVGLRFVGLDSGGDDSSDPPVITSSVARKTAKSTGKSRPKHPPDPSDPLRAG
ncbi:hypothetical protein [Streptomyces mirabilis]|uniref:hypothetical protein n=1 Tax=Streptomyces mirabilis TaxID=68239 RepID=UPI003252056D